MVHRGMKRRGKAEQNSMRSNTRTSAARGRDLQREQSSWIRRFSTQCRGIVPLGRGKAALRPTSFDQAEDCCGELRTAAEMQEHCGCVNLTYPAASTCFGRPERKPACSFAVPLQSREAVANPNPGQKTARLDNISTLKVEWEKVVGCVVPQALLIFGNRKGDTSSDQLAILCDL